MDLYLFPEAACLDNGYGIGVDFAYRKLCPKKEDTVIWYTIVEKQKMMYLRPSDIIIRKNNFFSYKSVRNILCGKDRTEVDVSELSFLKGKIYEHIHCDEVIFYRALRKIFPNAKMSLRLHNCFSRIYDRKKMLKQRLDWKYELKLRAMYRLERDIFNDKNVYKIFISDEDRNYYINNFGRYSDSETWAYIPNVDLIKQNRKPLGMYNHKIVWFGGVESHKEASIYWFIDKVFPVVKKAFPDAEFHLWGRNTLKFDNTENSVFGHGFYDGKDFPLTNSLYVNPDIIGGGIKLKLLTLIEKGIPFISSPFGFEGYSRDFIDNQYCYVVEEDLWANKIISILGKANDFKTK